jgi:septal ring factor EnvC (AmiA/AmiB activator)
MNYVAIVDKMRELARDLLRMRWINNIKDIILSINIEIAEYENGKKSREKDIKRLEYQISKLDEADPDYESKKKELEKSIEYQNKMIEGADKYIAKHKESVDKNLAEIAKVVSGEYKVSAENLSAKTKELIEEHVKAVAVSIDIVDAE